MHALTSFRRSLCVHLEAVHRTGCDRKTERDKSRRGFWVIEIAAAVIAHLRLTVSPSTPVPPEFLTARLFVCLFLFAISYCSLYDTLRVKRILTECADLLEVRNKYFEHKTLYSVFRNVSPEISFDFLREIGVFYKI